MSKAFTKEDDAGQDAGLPDRPISPHPNLVTAEGLAHIESTVAKLAEEQERAREGGDATAAANAARDLRYWSARRATAQLAEPKPSSQVQFGSRVTIKRADRRRIEFEAETWHALNRLALEKGKKLQDLAEDAFFPEEAP